MKKIRNVLGKKRERKEVREREDRATDEKIDEKIDPSLPVTRDQVLTREQSEQLDFMTLAGRPEVDGAKNERSLSHVHEPQTAPAGPRPDPSPYSRPERVHQVLPDRTPNVP